MRRIAQYRKAIAAFIVPFLSLPLAGWIEGTVPFSSAALAGAVVGGLSGYLTWRFPNDPRTQVTEIIMP